MKTFVEITPTQAWDMIKNEDAVLADIRDAARFSLSHVPEAFHLTNHNYADFLNEYDYDQAIIIICYHGESSKKTAQHLIHQGFECVYSVKGGFEAWTQSALPVEILR